MQRIGLGLALIVAYLAAAPTAWALSWGMDAVHPDNLCQTFGGALCGGGGYDTANNGNLGNAAQYNALRGNTLTFSDSGEDIIAAAFATTGAGDTLETAVLGNYPRGLGVLNFNLSDPHFVSNSSAVDMVIFYGPSDAFDPTSVFLANFGDSDVALLVGGTDAGFANGSDKFAGFAGLSLAGLEAMGFSREDNFDDNSGADRSVPIGPNLGTGRYLIVAALPGHKKERFKIGGVTGEVPEPSSALLLGLGVAGLVCARRRR